MTCISRTIVAAGAVCGLLGLTSLPVAAASVTPDVIFGSGNANGGFTIVQQGSLELGLRAKLRYDLNGQPQNIFPWDNVNTYTFDPSDGNAPANRAIWNFEWSVNTSWDGNGSNLPGFLFPSMTFQINVQGPGGLNTTYNPFGVSGTGFYFGNNSTPNGGGTELTLSNAGQVSSNNVAQQSVNIGFGAIGATDPQATGLYTVTLRAFDGQTELASNQIHINVIPLPGALPLMAGGIGLLGLMGWRRKRAAA